jgi:hypothetical protein
MVVIEAAVAAGIILAHHKKGKERRDAMRAEAEEDLRRRGWTGEGSQPSTPGGLKPPTPQHPPRPTSAPPPSYAPAGAGGFGAEKRQDWQQSPPGYGPPGGFQGVYQSNPPPQQQPYGYQQQYPPQPFALYGPPQSQPYENSPQYPQHAPRYPPPNASASNMSLPYNGGGVADGMKGGVDRPGSGRPYNERAATMPHRGYYGDGKRASTPPPMYRP